MSGDMETGRCDICGKGDGNTPVSRKTYYYGFKCGCHSPEHFEIVRYCKDCTPVPPKKTTAYMQPTNED